MIQHNADSNTGQKLTMFLHYPQSFQQIFWKIILCFSLLFKYKHITQPGKFLLDASLIKTQKLMLYNTYNRKTFESVN